MINYFTINTSVELLCLLIGSFCLYRDKEPIWRFFSLYLLITCFTELYAIYIRRVLGVSNVPLYNIFLIIEGVCVSLFFYHLYSQYAKKLNWLIIWLFLFGISYTIEMANNGFFRFVSKTASLLSFVFVLASLYFYYLMQKDEKYVKLSQHAPFWWINGALLFYFGGTATNVFFDYLITDQTSTFETSIRYIIFNILNLSLYCCWSYAFICRYLQRKSSPSSL